MNKYIVVTGGAGFIGSNLIKYLLLKTKYKIISIDNYSSGSKINHLINKRVNYIIEDTCNISNKLDKFKKKIIVMFHFGEFSRIHRKFYLILKTALHLILKEPQKCFIFVFRNNIRIIYSATSASLGNKGNDQSLSPYAFTKSKNLQLLSHLKKWFGLSYEASLFLQCIWTRTY